MINLPCEFCIIRTSCQQNFNENFLSYVEMYDWKTANRKSLMYLSYGCPFLRDYILDYIQETVDQYGFFNDYPLIFNVPKTEVCYL